MTFVKGVSNIELGIKPAIIFPINSKKPFPEPRSTQENDSYLCRFDYYSTCLNSSIGGLDLLYKRIRSKYMEISLLEKLISIK